uniref:Uncharacterized protein n=1 Tax=Panagrolaimus sp. PS1159 TaxID=55785 RepID=A0AC35EUK7_9BILA
MEKRATAVIFKNEKDGKEYLKLNKNEHICDLKEVDLIKFKDDLMIQKPMYEIVEKYVCGKKKKFLLIFTDAEKEYCYKFGYSPSEKCFCCTRCNYLTRSIRAFLTKKNGDERVYSNIVKSPKFQLITRKVNQKIVKRLVVFVNDDKTECYEYTWSKNHKIYVCSPCKTQAHVFAKIYKNEENGEFVELCQKQHKCKPIKFIPEKNVKTVFEPNFEIDEYILGGIKRKRIKLFDKSDKNLCYYYYKETGRDTYLCSTCRIKQKHVTAKLLHDEKTDKKYLELNEVEHVCEPQKTTKITTIQKPNFKLEECIIDGFRRKFIIIFDKIDSTLCYKYCYFGTDKAYLCINCKKAERLVTARLKNDKSGEEYIALNKNEHICTPIKYNPKEFSTRILTTENFKQENITVNGIEKKRLIINTTTKKEKYYVYVYSSKDDFHICKNWHWHFCLYKLLKDGNGEDYLRMGNKMHNNKCRALTKS